jgi:hypothetical protein
MFTIFYRSGIRNTLKENEYLGWKKIGEQILKVAAAPGG